MGMNYLAVFPNGTGSTVKAHLAEAVAHGTSMVRMTEEGTVEHVPLAEWSPVTGALLGWDGDPLADTKGTVRLLPSPLSAT